MFSRGSGAAAGILRVAVLAIACACAGAASPARAWAAARDGGESGVLAAAERLAGARRHAAAESLLRTLPPAPADRSAPLDPAQVRLERAWLRARVLAPGACDSTWRWRPARVLDALARAGERPDALAGAWIDRSRVEFRLGLWSEAAASAREALAQLAHRREPLARYRANLALAEALATQDGAAARAPLRAADSLAGVLGPAAAAERPRHLRLAGLLAIAAGDMAEGARLMGECVAAADALVPPDDAEAGLGLVFRGYAEGFSDPRRGEDHRARARERLEAALGLGDERTLLAIGRSIVNLRDPATLPAIGALLDRADAHLRAHGLGELAAAWDVDYFRSRVRIELGRHDEAIALLRHAVAVSRRWHGPDNLRERTATIDLGIANWRRGDTTAALPHFERALAIGARHPVSVFNDPNVPRQYLALAYAARGRLADARAMHAAMWESYRERYGEAFLLTGRPAVQAARCSRGLGDTAQTELWYRRALLPFASGENGTLEEAAWVRASYALFLHWRGDDERSFGMALESARFRRQVIDETVPWLAERDALRFANLRRQEHETLMTLALRATGSPAHVRAAAWTEMAMGRGLLLEALLRRVRRDGEADTAAAALRRELASQVLASLRAPESQAWRWRLDSLRTEIARREAGPGGARSVEPAPVLAAADAGRQLGDGALVSYLRTNVYEKEGATGDATWWPREQYLAFVLTPPDTAPLVLALGRADSIDAAVRAWRAAALANPPARGADQAGERLRRLVWDPLVAHLPASGNVWFVPDGELQKVNLYALPVAPGRFLVDEPLVLHRLSSERDLLAGPAPAPAGGVLAVGGIDYEGATAAARADSAARPLAALPACRAFLDEHFAPLPATAREAGAIAELGRALATGARAAAPVSLTGRAADEASFKRLAPGRRVVHLATHSWFLGPECASGPGAANVLAQNPLVFSGIALAGANRWHDARERGEVEDGLLTAEELAGLDLRGTEWLVLSGCESGLGEVQSWEGVFGLPRAGRRAGVRTLVMSLAPVDDEASAMWMRALYDARFTRGEPTASAVRSASRRVLDWLRRRGRAPEPRLWGAFVALGE